MMGKIILASSSPRRQNILKETKLKFEVKPSRYEEDHTQTVFSYDFIEKLAYNKALEVAQRTPEEALVIGADTMVVIDNEILGKPKDEEEAISMLKRLSGRKHMVVTAIAVINTKAHTVKKTSVTSFVEFETLTEPMIQSYVRDYKPLDKAGAYGIQELPSGFVKNVEGSFKNIIGLCPEALMELIV